jgi:hypothetical protein
LDEFVERAGVDDRVRVDHHDQVAARHGDAGVQRRGLAAGRHSNQTYR